MTEERLDEQQIKRNRRSLILLFALGIVPLFVAYTVYFYFPDLMPSTTTNQGQLISPPVSAEELGIPNSERKWVLAIPLDVACDESCESRFYLARQVNVALGKESTRVARLAALTDAADETQVNRIKADYPEMTFKSVSKSRWESLLGGVLANPVNGTHIYLVDPHGNVMMIYTLEQAGKPMLKDLKHLLKISNIG